LPRHCRNFIIFAFPCSDLRMWRPISVPARRMPLPSWPGSQSTGMSCASRGDYGPLPEPIRLSPCRTSQRLCQVTYHGMISQIPESVFCVSLARARVYTSGLGTVSVHRIPGSFFFGYADGGHEGIAMASPEKALLDFLYLGRAKSRLFAALPELTLPAGFRRKRARSMVGRIRDKKRRTHVRVGLEELLTRYR
jgi:hypothetical protein